MKNNIFISLIIFFMLFSFESWAQKEKRQVDGFDAPAFVDDGALERRRAADVPHEAYGLGIKVVPEGHLVAFCFGHDRLQRYRLGEGFLTAFVDLAHRSADIDVFVRPDVKLQEVDQPSFPLQEGQHLDGRRLAG